MNASLDSPMPMDESVNVDAYFPRLFPLDWGNAGQYELMLVKPSEAHDTKADLGIPYHAQAVTVTIQEYVRDACENRSWRQSSIKVSLLGSAGAFEHKVTVLNFPPV